MQMKKFMLFYLPHSNQNVISKILTFKWESNISIEFQTHLFFSCFTKHLLSTDLLNVFSRLKYDLLFLVCYLWYQHNFNCILSTVISFVILYSQLSNIFLLLFLFSMASCTCTFPFFTLTSLINTLSFFYLHFSWNSKLARVEEENFRAVIFVVSVCLSFL